MSSGKLRLFVALELPEAVRAALPVAGPPWRAVPAGSLHVTLAFLGWRGGEDADAAAAAVRESVRAVEALALAGFELLPPRAPRVLALRVDDPTRSLVALQAALSASLAAAGVYEPEQRPYLPHVTIGRTRDRLRPRDVVPPPFERLDFAPESVALLRSHPVAGGSRYEALERWSVAPGGA